MDKLIQPGFGLIIWQAVIFLVVLFLLTKFAWKPVLKSIKDREATIEGALNAAEEAKAEMAKLKSDNERLIKEAKVERDAILKAANETAEKLITESKLKAREEADKEKEKVLVAIENEKRSAVASLRKEAADLSVEIAEKVLRKELSQKPAQDALLDSYVKEGELALLN